MTEYSGAGSFIQGTNFNERVETSNTMIEDRIVSATGTYAGTAEYSHGGGAEWVMSVASFKIADAGAAGQPTSKRHGGVPFMASPGRRRVWAPVFKQNMMVGPSRSWRAA